MHEKRNVLEAKIKKIVNKNETNLTKSKEKTEKGIEKLGESMNKLANKFSTV